MRLTRHLALALFTLLVIALLWVLWSRPTRVDMSAYVPADSFAYLEANSVADVITALQHTDAWNQLGPLFQLESHSGSNWLTTLARNTGFGSTELVLFSRSQVAVSVLNVGTLEDAGNLKIKPEIAIVIETHTSARRIKPLTQQLLARLAVNTYGNPSFSQMQRDGLDFLTWSAPEQDRKIIAVIDGTVVFIGNTEAAISACLSVRRDRRASLKSSGELQDMRLKLDSGHSLAFGYVPSANAVRLVSIAAPLLVGNTDSGFQQLLPTAAGKILGSIGWSARATHGGIEDRYLFSLAKPVVSQLQSPFSSISKDDEKFASLIGSSSSATVYRLQSPFAGWQGFESAVLSQLDAVSAVLFKALLKASLSSYGVEDAEKFVRLVQSPVLTLHLNEGTARSTLVVRVAGEESQRALLEMVLGNDFNRASNGYEVYMAPDKEHVVARSGDYWLIGPASDVRVALTLLANSAPSDRPLPSPSVELAAVRTYFDDSQRVRSFFSAVSGGQTPSGDPSTVEDRLFKLPPGLIESSITNDGIDRRTRSPLGQFATLVSLVAE